jgi:methanogenic corrinoid protein MtbC1
MDDLLAFLAASERPLLNPLALGLSESPLRPVATRLVGGTALQAAFREALAVGDEKECSRLLDLSLTETNSVADTTELLITDAMHRFGEAWDHNELDVYQERRGFDICLRLIFEMRRRLPQPRGPIAIGGSPSGDPYQLPTALVELALREAGWQSYSLGADIPFPSFQQAIRDYAPKLVWFSVSTITDVETFTQRFNAVAEALPEDCAVLVGGRGLTDNVRPRLRYTAHCDNLRQLVSLAEVMRRRTNDWKNSVN